MPVSASELIARHRAALAAACDQSRLDRLARRFGNISIAATLLMAPLTAAGGYIAFKPRPLPALAAPAQAAQPHHAPLRTAPLRLERL